MDKSCKEPKLATAPPAIAAMVKGIPATPRGVRAIVVNPRPKPKPAPPTAPLMVSRKVYCQACPPDHCPVAMLIPYLIPLKTTPKITPRSICLPKTPMLKGSGLGKTSSITSLSF